MRFHYDLSRAKFDVVTAIEIGDLDRGYREIKISGNDAKLYSLACPLYLGLIIVAIPKYTKGMLTVVPKNKDGQPLKSRTEALAPPRGQHARLASAAGLGGQGKCCHRGGERCGPGNQGMAGDHGLPSQPAGQESGRTAHDPRRRSRR